MSYTNLENKIKEIFFVSNNSWDELEVSITEYRTNEVKLTISKMYEYVDISFENLQKLSEVFETKKINVGSPEFSNGCETCDHGSSYTQTIYLKEIDLVSLSKKYK